MDAPITHKQSEGVAIVQLGRHTAYELILTSILLFGVTTIVRWVIGPSLISRSIPQIHAELVLVGAAVALLLAGLILSPMGRASGGHMNPAISLAMWRFGVFPGAGVVPYRIAQLLGSVVGVLAARVVWGQVIAEPPVVYAALQPGPLWSIAELFAAETLSMAVIVLIVGICLAEDRLAPFVPWVVGVLIGIAIAVLGTSTGGSVNPARQFGPAVCLARRIPVGISTCPDARSSDRGMATTDDPAPPRRIDPPTMRHPTGRPPAVRCSGPRSTALPMQRTGGQYEPGRP